MQGCSVDNGFVDLGIVEEAIAWLDFRDKELEAALTAAKVQVPTAERAKPATSRNNRYYDTNRYNNNGQGNNQGYNQSYNQNYNANYAPRGGRGGRGNRGGRGGRGYQGNY